MWQKFTKKKIFYTLDFSNQEGYNFVKLDLSN